MRRAAAALVVVAVLLPAAPAAAGTWRMRACRYQSVDRASWSQLEVRRTIACAVRHFAVPGGVRKALSVARCESGLRARAGAGSSYLGVYQHAARYWPSRWRSAWGRIAGDRVRRNALNGRSNVIVGIRMAHAVGWGPWSCA